MGKNKSISGIASTIKQMMAAIPTASQRKRNPLPSPELMRETYCVSENAVLHFFNGENDSTELRRTITATDSKRLPSSPDKPTATAVIKSTTPRKARTMERIFSCFFMFLSYKPLELISFSGFREVRVSVPDHLPG